MLEFFFSPERPIALLLNLAIVGIAVLGLAQVVRALISHVRPTQNDLRQLRQREGFQDTTALMAFAHQATPDGLVRRRLELLERFRQQGEPVDMEMLAAISAEAFRDAAPIARWATSMLVLLGLAGTLVGLSLAVGELSGLLQGDMGARAMANAILETLGQMKVAFSTTLAGVLGGVTVGSAMAFLRHEQSKALRELEELSATEWTPLFQTTEQSRINHAVDELVETRKVLQEGLERTVADLGEGFRDLSDQFGEQSRSLLDQVGLLRDATLEIIGERDEDSLSLAQYVETVKATTDELQESVRASGELLPRIQNTLEETIQREQQALAQTLSEHTRAVRPILEKQEQSADALHQAVTGELARLGEVRDVLERLNESFERARGTWERADQSIEKMGRETAHALRDGLSQSLDAVTRLTEEQTRSQQRVTGALDGFQASYEEALRLLAAQSTRALHQSQEMVQEIRETLQESLELVGQRLAETQRGTGERVATSITALGRELRDLSVSKASGTTPRREPRPGPQSPEENSAKGGNGPGSSRHPTSPSVPSDPGPNPPPSLEEIQDDLRGIE